MSVIMGGMDDRQALTREVERGSSRQVVALALRVSSEMVCSDTGVKRELMRSWLLVIIQVGLFEEVQDEASCW